MGFAEKYRDPVQPRNSLLREARLPAQLRREPRASPSTAKENSRRCSWTTLFTVLGCEGMNSSGLLSSLCLNRHRTKRRSGREGWGSLHGNIGGEQNVYASNVPTNTQRFTVGPMLEVRLPLGLGVDFDALYKRFNQTRTGVGITGTASKTGSSWEFPLLAKYRFGSWPAKPYVEGGVSFYHTRVEWRVVIRTNICRVGDTRKLAWFAVLQRSPAVAKPAQCRFRCYSAGDGNLST